MIFRFQRSCLHLFTFDIFTYFIKYRIVVMYENVESVHALMEILKIAQPRFEKCVL